MQWNFLFWIVMSSATIVTSGSDGLKHKRSLSYIARLFSNNNRRSQGKCTQSQRKPLNEYEILELPAPQTFIVDAVPEITRSKVPNRVRNREDNFFINLNSDPFQILTQTLGSITNTFLGRSTTEKSIKERTLKTNYLAGNKIAVNHRSIVTMTPTNFGNIVYDRPKSLIIPPVVQFVSPIIAMPRKYSYEQIKGDTVQKFSLDENSDVVVTEKKHVPRPAYVDDRMKDIILSVPPYTQHIFSSVSNEDYDKVKMISHMGLGQQQEEYAMKMLSNNIESMYNGDPIIVLDHGNRMNEAKRHIKIEPRGDIPD